MVSREIDEFFKKFVSDFSGLGLKWNMPDTEWTDRIFKYLSKLGKSCGFNPYYENNPIEYLLDMCWVYAQEKPQSIGLKSPSKSNSRRTWTA